MTSAQIRCFLEAAKSLNFTYAASKLYISQSTLSKNIGAMEQELELQLFIRDRRGIRLTPGGALLYERLVPAAQEYEKWVQQAKMANQGLSGNLRIGHLSTQRINDDCARHLAAFEEKYQNIHISIEYDSFSQLLKKLRRGELDMAISTTFEVEHQPDLRHQEFVRVNNLLVIPHAYQLRRPELRTRENLTFSEFSEETFLTVDEKESEAITPLLTQSCAQAGFVPRLLVAPNYETCLFWLETGRGLFALNVENMIFSSNKIRSMAFPEFPPITLSVAWMKETENPCVSLLAGELPKL